MTAPAGRTFTFTARLDRSENGAMYSITIPAAVSRAIDKRGPVPIIATVNALAELAASLVPTGGGRHRLQLPARVRTKAKAQPGDHIAIVLRVDDAPLADPTPADLSRALREPDVLGAFERLPVGKRNHIIRWINEAVADSTREKRIGMAVEVAQKAEERQHDRDAKKAKRKS